MEIRFLMSAAALCADCGNDSESARAQDARVRVRPARGRAEWQARARP